MLTSGICSNRDTTNTVAAHRDKELGLSPGSNTKVNDDPFLHNSNVFSGISCSFGSIDEDER